MKDSDLLAVFDSMDTDKSGSISKSELKIALDKTGLKFSDKDIDAMVFAADENKDDSISKEEWLNLCKHIHKENHKSTHPVSNSSDRSGGMGAKVQLSMQDVAEGTGHTHVKK